MGAGYATQEELSRHTPHQRAPAILDSPHSLNSCPEWLISGPQQDVEPPEPHVVSSTLVLSDVTQRTLGEVLRDLPPNGCSRSLEKFKKKKDYLYPTQ